MYVSYNNNENKHEYQASTVYPTSQTISPTLESLDARDTRGEPSCMKKHGLCIFNFLDLKGPYLVKSIEFY